MIDEQIREEDLLVSAVKARPDSAVTLDETKMWSDIARPGEPRASLWRNRDFNIFWLGQTLSTMGDSFAFIAMPLLVLAATGSVAQMGLVTATFGGAELVMGIFAGPIVDRVNRRKLMIVSDVIRTIVYAAIPLCWWLAGPQIWLIYVVMGVGGLFANLSGVAYITAITNLVDKEDIVSAVSRLETTGGIGFIIGPMLAGIVSYNLGGPVAAIGIDALSFVASVVTLLLIHFRPYLAPPREKKESMVQELSAGVRFLMSNRLLRAATVVLGFMTMLTVAGLDLFIYHVKRDLGGDDNAVGIILGLAAIGGVVASMLVPLLRRTIGFGMSYIGANVVQSLSLIAIGLAPTVLLVAPLTVTYILGERTRGLNTMTMRQQITPNHLLGRVTAAFWTLGAVLGPLGAALVTALAAQVGTPTALVVMGSLGVLVALVALFTPVNVAHPEQVYGVGD